MYILKSVPSNQTNRHCYFSFVFLLVVKSLILDIVLPTKTLHVTCSVFLGRDAIIWALCTYSFLKMYKHKKNTQTEKVYIPTKPSTHSSPARCCSSSALKLSQQPVMIWATDASPLRRVRLRSCRSKHCPLLCSRRSREKKKIIIIYFIILGIIIVSLREENKDLRSNSQRLRDNCPKQACKLSI